MESPTSPARPFGLDLVRSPTPSPWEESILAIFSDALQSSDTGIKNASSAAAIAINTLCPPIEDTRDSYAASKAAEGFLWELWTIVLNIARAVPHDAEHPSQATLVGILDELRYLPRGTVTLWGSDMQLWRDLPLFVQRIADSSGGPDDNDLSEDAVRHWRNQNAFSARCLEAGLAGCDDLAVYALRDALEVQVDNGKNILIAQRCAILVATEWVIHGGPNLFQRAEASDDRHEGGIAYECDDDVPPGALFCEQEPDARAGLSRARWAFWKQRFQALLQPAQVLPKDVRAAVIVAIERMTLAETKSAEEAAEQLCKWESVIDAEDAEEDEMEDKVDDKVDNKKKSKERQWCVIM